jgi:trimethylamine:corrinoid methyltransferase-like protein
MKKANDAPFLGPQFALLSESQLKDIHLASLEVLRRTGAVAPGFGLSTTGH